MSEQENTIAAAPNVKRIEEASKAALEVEKTMFTHQAALARDSNLSQIREDIRQTTGDGNNAGEIAANLEKRDRLMKQLLSETVDDLKTATAKSLPHDYETEHAIQRSVDSLVFLAKTQGNTPSAMTEEIKHWIIEAYEHDLEYVHNAVTGGSVRNLHVFKELQDRIQREHGERIELLHEKIAGLTPDVAIAKLARTIEASPQPARIAYGDVLLELARPLEDMPLFDKALRLVEQYGSSEQKHQCHKLRDGIGGTVAAAVERFAQAIKNAPEAEQQEISDHLLKLARTQKRIKDVATFDKAVGLVETYGSHAQKHACVRLRAGLDEKGGLWMDRVAVLAKNNQAER